MHQALVSRNHILFVFNRETAIETDDGDHVKIVLVGAITDGEEVRIGVVVDQEMRDGIGIMHDTNDGEMVVEEGEDGIIRFMTNVTTLMTVGDMITRMIIMMRNMYGL